MEVSTYKDISGLFTTSDIRSGDQSVLEKTPKPADKSFTFDESNVDDEDEMLYGESDTSMFSSSFNMPSSTPQKDNR